MKKNIAVIGLGTFGKELALALSKAGHYVLAADKTMSRVNEIKDSVEVAIEADVTDPDVLDKINISEFDKVIIGTGNLESSILAIVHMKKMGVKHMIVKANNRVQAEIFQKIGADRIVLPEIEAARDLAEKITHPQIIEKFKIDSENTLVEIKVPENFIGKTLIELDLRKKYNINAVMITREGKSQLITDPHMKFQKGDTVLLIGNESRIKKIMTN